MKNWISICAGVLITIFGTAAGAQTTTNISPAAPDDVRIEHNIPYLGESRSEKADLYLPANIPAQTRVPAVVIIHGGGWNDGQRNAQREINIGTTLARNGYVGLSVDYLLSHGRDVVWPTNLYDCKNAVRWLRKNADRLHVNPDKIGVIGGSAGGHLAAMVALTADEPALEPGAPYPGLSDRVLCCVDLYGIAEVSTFEARAAMLGPRAAEAPALYRAASPITYVRSNSPPILIIHGTADKTVSPRQSELFGRVLTQAGVEHELVWVPEAPHSFTLQPKQRDLRPLVLAFFNRHLKPVSSTPPPVSPASRTNATVVIIKADDFRGVSKAWTNFLAVSRAAGVKVSIGVIAESIQTNASAAAWMKTQVAQGDVEFWNHGWDHKQWNEGDKTVSEFGGSGLPHQREHLAQSQAALKQALGQDVTAFGTPFNALDADTATVIDETPELRLLFTHRLSVAKAIHHPIQLVDIISESDGTGKPNAAKFEAAWRQRAATSAPVSLQFHPPYFDAARLDEYKKILAFLQAQGCSLQLPSQLADKTP